MIMSGMIQSSIWIFFICDQKDITNPQTRNYFYLWHDVIFLSAPLASVWESWGVCSDILGWCLA